MNEAKKRSYLSLSLNQIPYVEKDRNGKSYSEEIKNHKTKSYYEHTRN